MYLLLTHESTREKCSPLAHGLRLELSNVGKIHREFAGTKWADLHEMSRHLYK